MNADELRNYAHHMNDLDERRGQLVFSQDELISAYKRALSCEQYRMESLNALKRVQDTLGELSRNMEQKYEYAMPRPCCIESSKEVSGDGHEEDAAGSGGQ
jgi:CDP-glycerol glycerophosphotransferase (TagB/SpsB family)